VGGTDIGVGVEHGVMVAVGGNEVNVSLGQTVGVDKPAVKPPHAVRASRISINKDNPCNLRIIINTSITIRIGHFTTGIAKTLPWGRILPEERTSPPVRR
jgi:hypothetical protein